MADQQEGKKGMTPGQRMGMIILFAILIFMNVFGMLAGQLNSLLQTIRFNMAPIIVIGIIWLLISSKKGNS